MKLRQETQIPYTVRELTEEIRRNLEERYEWVHVRGELSTYKKAPSGHAYFRLKDLDAVLECVAWKGTVVRWAGLDLEDGREVIAGGRITVYPPRGQYQLVVSTIQPAGIGILQQRFEELKQRLAREGLFDAARKRSLPAFPEKVAVITSPTGAAVQDFLKILHSNHCPVDVTICPVLVQGENAAADIAQMIRRVNAMNVFDLIVLCRGGGSLEDLWAFNEEITARAIFGAKTPVITGIGHEIDFTIADFVADVRAPTPTGAAQSICDLFDHHRYQLSLFSDRLLRIALPQVERWRERLDLTQKIIERYHPISLINQKRQRLDELHDDLFQHIKIVFHDRRRQLNERKKELLRAAKHELERHKNSLHRYENLLKSYDPAQTLARGFCICRKNGRLVMRVADVAPDDTLRITVSDGSIDSKVIEVDTKP